MVRKKVDEFFNVPSNEEISGLSSLSNALGLINQTNAITPTEPVEIKKFVVKKKEELKELVNLDFFEKVDIELDEIANQADSAFEEIMDIAINAPTKNVGEITSAAQKLLETKLSAKTAKLEKKLKILNFELSQRKQQFIENTKKTGAIIDDENTPVQPDEDGKISFDRNKFY